MNSREQARKLFEEQGERLTDISEKLGINYNTIKQWKSRYKWKGVTKKKKKRLQKIVTAKPEDPVIPLPVNEKDDDSLELTERQRLFAEIYIRNFNATQAAIKAGYAPSGAFVEGCRLLKHPKVRAYIEELKALKKETLMIDQDDIVERYMRIAFSDMTDFAEFGSEKATVEDQDGNEEVIDRDYFRFRDSKSVDGGLIVEVKRSRQGMSIKLEDRQKALAWLAKFFEMDPENKWRKEFDSKKLQLDQDRFEHQKNMDKIRNW